MTQQTLVIGHYRDPIHPFSDSDMLVRELPNARLAPGVVDPRAAPHAGAADQRDRRVHRALLQAGAEDRRAAPGGRRDTPRRVSHAAGDLSRPFTTLRRRVPPQRTEGGAAPRARGARAQARAAEQRKKMVGYGVGGAARDRRRGRSDPARRPAADEAAAAAPATPESVPRRRQLPGADGLRGRPRGEGRRLPAADEEGQRRGDHTTTRSTTASSTTPTRPPPAATTRSPPRTASTARRRRTSSSCTTWSTAA